MNIRLLNIVSNCMKVFGLMYMWIYFCVFIIFFGVLGPFTGIAFVCCICHLLLQPYILIKKIAIIAGALTIITDKYKKIDIINTYYKYIISKFKQYII